MYQSSLIILFSFCRMRYVVLLSIFLCPLVLLSAQTGTLSSVNGSETGAARLSPRVTTEAADAGEDYLIASDDLLDVFIVDVAEMSRTYRVSPSGTISLPLLGKPLRAAGLTLIQLSESIQDALHTSGVVTNAQVTVSVQQSRTHSVSVTGAVKHPQIYPVFGHSTLLDVISQAEGLSDDAGNIAIVSRGDIAIRALKLDSEDNAALTSRVDIRQLMEARDPSANIVIYPGDRVTIPKAGIVYVVGGVNKPGGFTLRPGRQGMTVMQAIALAEDVKSTARRDRAVIVRVDSTAKDGHVQIPVNLKTIFAGKCSDPVLQAEDILFVPDSTGKKVMQRGLESILQVATGVALYAR